jgi:hypothetical protein
MCEKHEPSHLFGKGEGTFQLSIGERDTHFSGLRELTVRRSQVHCGPPDDRVSGWLENRGRDYGFPGLDC